MQTLRSSLLAVCVATAASFAPSGGFIRAPVLRSGAVARHAPPSASNRWSMQLLGPDGKPLVFGGGGDEGGAKIKPAKECNELMGTGDYSYLDVRLPDEVAQGAPGDKEWSCVNFAAFQRSEMGVEPDKEGFLKKVASYFPDKSVKLIVGCAGAPTSMRSSEAAGWLSDDGYSMVINCNEGFVGWKARGLPYKKAGSNAIF